MIEVKESRHHDRGVFATKRIPEGTLITVAHVLQLSKRQWDCLEKTKLSHYVFDFGRYYGMAMGEVSFLNHSYAPNARYWTNEDDRTVEVVALTDIPRGAEVTINYNGEPDDDGPLWFRVKK